MNTTAAADSAPRSLEEWEAIDRILKDHPTPFLVLNVDKVRRRCREIAHAFPAAKIYYSVKSNPAIPVLEALRDEGAYFDCASIYEMDRVLSLGVAPDRLSFGNTIKKEKDIATAFQRGVRLFASDSEGDILKISRVAPGSKVFFRLITQGSGADWPLSKKFGSHPDLLYHLILKARDLGLEPYGLSFHVGSQQRDIGQWDDAIAHCRYLFNAAAEAGIHLKMLNLGGGLPASYLGETHPLDTYAAEIYRYLREDFPDGLPEILLEPGRAMVGDAGVLVSEVILISQKNRRDTHRWIYLDVGLFGGLIETLGEAIKYPLITDRTPKGQVEDIPAPGEKRRHNQIEAIIAGPTCDSMDILYQNHRYHMPAELAIGDKVYFLSTGAYTTSYSSVEFNGFPPLKAFYINKVPGKPGI